MADVRPKLIHRSTAVALAGTGLVILAFPRSCSAEVRAKSACEIQSISELRDTSGRVFVLVHAQCHGEDRIDICDGKHCQSDRCAPAGVTVAGKPGSLPLWDGWLEPPMLLPRKNGSQDVLVVRRLGNGGYPHIVRYSVSEGRAVCQDVTELDAVVSAAAETLDAGQSFGFRGGRLEVVADQLVLTRGIYFQEDAACCPTGGSARLWTRFSEGRLELVRVDRIPPVSSQGEGRSPKS